MIVVMQQTTSLLSFIICFCSFYLGLSVVFVFKFLSISVALLHISEWSSQSGLHR